MKKAFTLSEVLITLSIVGVVAVLTIPSVVKNYRNRLYVSQLQKVTAQVENATKQIMNDEHVDNFLETKVLDDSVTVNGTEMTGWQYFMTQYFKTSKTDCNTGTCFASSYKTISGDKLDFNLGSCGVKLTSGAVICVTYNTTNYVPTVNIDVNGLAEPNIIGRDYFHVDIQPDGSLKDPSPASECNNNTSGWDGASAYAAGCYTNIVEAGWKMEY